MGSRLVKNTRIFRVGTRKSPLALAQTKEALAIFKKKFPNLIFRIVPLLTEGDEFQSVEIFKRGGEGVFTKGVEKELLARRIDLAVHSLKDLPTTLTKGLALAAVLKRADTSDALVTKKRLSLGQLPVGAKVGTGSLRRKEQLRRLRPDLQIEVLRGNLDTRVRKVIQTGQLDAVVLATAGLTRLKSFSKYSRKIPQEMILPAVGQGAIALQARVTDRRALAVAASANHRPTELAVRAERAFLEELHGGCRVPIGVLTKIGNKKIRVKGAIFSVGTNQTLSAACGGPSDKPEKVGRALAKKLLQKGAAKLLERARA